MSAPGTAARRAHAPSAANEEPRLPKDGWLYVGEVMHHRLRPKRHRFVYRVFTMLLDLDRMADLDGRLRLFSVDRRNLFSFWQKDHGPRDGGPLRPWVERQLAAANIDLEGGRILLLAMPRLLGYVFNPLSVYYCFDRELCLRAIVYEVKNTFGGQHAYALRVAPDGLADAPVRQRVAKDFPVSPFIEAEAIYHFRALPPGDALSLAIKEEVEGKPLLLATITGQRRPLTDAGLAKIALRLPFVTHKVMAAIHLEAFLLWLKGIVLQPAPPDATPAPGFSGDQANST